MSTQIDRLQVLDAQLDHLTPVYEIQAANKEYIGFYPISVFEREAEQKRLKVAVLDGEVLGYCFFGSPHGDLRIHQLCVREDWRRKNIARRLVAEIEVEMEHKGTWAIIAKCGSDMKATNAFWEAMNYKCMDVREGGSSRGRKINVWRKEIHKHLFDFGEVEPSSAPRDRSKRKKVKRVDESTVREPEEF